MPTSKVKIVGPDYLIRRMYVHRGWKVVEDQLDDDVDLIQFTGGEDISPSYYNQPKHARTYSNPKRDEYEMNIFNKFKGVIPMAGICRGGQLLNVANGGSMFQHVNNHGESHKAFCHLRGIEIVVSSCHHQMMIPTKEAQILMTASRASVKESYDSKIVGEGVDMEAVYYPSTMSLCYQPHPEYNRDSEDEETYFLYLKTFFGIE